MKELTANKGRTGTEVVNSPWPMTHKARNAAGLVVCGAGDGLSA